jgi:tetratricopeptide (TPR) repeat protein
MSTPTNRSFIRRELVQGQDPLLESGRTPNSNASPVPNDPLSYFSTPPPPVTMQTSSAPPNSLNVTPVPQFPQRAQTITDSIEIQADSFLRNCCLPVERQKGIMLKSGDVPLSIEGLQKLRQCSSWQEVMKLSQHLLLEPAVNTLTQKERVEILALRFDSLFRIKLFDDLQSELQKEISTIESQIQTNDSEFSIQEFDRITSYHLLLQEVRVMSGQGVSALEGFLGLSHSLEKYSRMDDAVNISEMEMHLKWRGSYWRWVALLHVINCRLRLRQWRSALWDLRKLQQEVTINSLAIHEEEKCDLCYARVLLSIRVMRLLLQIGDKASARIEFENAAQSIAQFPSLTGDEFLQQSLLLGQGLLYFAEEQYEAAAETFTNLLTSEKSRVENANSLVVKDCAKLSTDFTRGGAAKRSLLEARDEGILSAATNNLALTLLHLKQNHSAIAKLESLIAENPPLFMTDAVVFNLCTLYDLSYSPDSSQQKKKVLQKVALRFGLVDPVLHWRSFRSS